ncbi:MAG: alpha-L-fucosidase [Kiritimatiellia bacterium]
MRLQADEWGELCSCWTGSWSHTRRPFRPFDDVVGELVRCQAAGINNLLDIGPMADGNLEPAAYRNLARMEAWMKVNGEAVHGTRALPEFESATVPATSKGAVRYLYLLPAPKGAPDPAPVSLSGLRGAAAWRASLLGDGRKLAVATEGDFSADKPIPSFRLSSPGGHGGADSEGLARTVDRNTGTKWCLGHGNRFPVVWQAEAVGERPPVTSYALVSANDMPDRDPGSWRFLGSQDGVSWTLLDERTGEPVWEGRESRREFKTGNRTAYAHYRFEFVKVHNAAPMLQLSEIELLPLPVVGGTLTISPPSGTPDSGVRVVKIEPAG